MLYPAELRARLVLRTSFSEKPQSIHRVKPEDTIFFKDMRSRTIAGCFQKASQQSRAARSDVPAECANALPEPQRNDIMISFWRNGENMRFITMGFVAAVLAPAGASAAPSQLYGKSVTVRWSETRSQRAVGQ